MCIRDSLHGRTGARRGRLCGPRGLESLRGAQCRTVGLLQFRPIDSGLPRPRLAGAPDPPELLRREYARPAVPGDTEWMAATPHPIERMRARVGEELFARVAGKDGHAARTRVHETPGPRCCLLYT